MRGDPSRAVRRWIAVATGLAGSGLIAPVGPHAIAASARAYRRFGPTPATLLALSAIRHPGETAVVDERGAVTYRELQRRAEAIAAALYAMADVPPASVGVLCRNHRGFVEAMAAGAQLGAELVFINTELPDAQLRAVLDRHRPDVLIHDDEYSSAVEASGVPGLRVLAWHAAERDAATTPTLDELARTRRPAPPQVRRAVKVTLLTSGTTGIAKGVPRSVEPAALAALAATAMATVRMRRTDRVLVAPPMFHGFGLLSLLGPLALGATVVCRRTFDARQALEDIERERVTVLVAVPVMLQRILAALDADGAPVRELRAVVTGAAPITRATVSALIRRFGPVVVNGYGSTEAGLVAIATPTDLAHAPGSVGRAALGVSVRVLRPDRTPAGAGEAGEIFVRSGLGYEGYTRDANAGHRAKEIIDGHVATGDMGHRDAEGRLFVDGRADDMIVSGGENVFPGEVEDRIAAHPAVADVVVVGVAHAEFGQALHAFLVVAPGAAQPTDAELREFVLGRLERYKVPKRFTVLDAIPRNASGKVLRSDLPAGAIA